MTTPLLLQAGNADNHDQLVTENKTISEIVASSDPDDEDDDSSTAAAAAAAAAAAEAIQRNALANLEKGGALIKSISQNEVLNAMLDASVQISANLFRIFRRTAAMGLTASLPEDEREELLVRTLGKERVQAARTKLLKLSSNDNDDETEKSQSTFSVQENVAAANVKKKQRQLAPDQWEQEKEKVYKQAEQAAKERVETELAIQKQRMEQEKRQYVNDAKKAMQDLTEQKDELAKLQADIEREKAALVAEQTSKRTAAAAQEEDQTEKLLAMEHALKEKETQAKKDQEEMERLSLKLKEAEVKAITDDNAPGNRKEERDQEKPRIHAGRYTAEEYRNLSDEEKVQVKALREQQHEETPVSTQASTKSDPDVHPVLGPVIEDLRYKRMHLLSAGKLGTIPIWKKQRIYRHDRAKAMVNDKWKSMNLGLPGIICLHEDRDGKLSIIDGQHRVGMMMLLRDKQRKARLQKESSDDTAADDDDDENRGTIDFDRVLVEVYPYNEANGDDAKHAQDLFLEINKAEPIKLIDMPGVAKSKDRKVITEAVDSMYELYPNMFSPSQRCRAPNVNVDNMRNNLFGASVMTKHNLTTTKKLVDWLLEQNEVLARKYEEDLEVQASVSPNAWKKASSNGFYLGLESKWLYN